MFVNPLNTVYANDIFRMAAGKEDKMFYNSSTAHASIVHQALAKYATDYIDIFSSSMCTEISNNKDYCKYIENYLEGGKERKIRIILTDYSERFNETKIGLLFAKYPGQVSIKSYKGKVIYKDSPAHFTVSDDRAFRLETDIERHMAFGNFNSPEQARALKETFDKIFNSPLAKDVCLAR